MLPDIGWTEFFVILLIAIIVVKPEDWPKVFRKAGHYYGRVHEFMMSLRSYSQETMQQISQLDVKPDPDDDRETGEPGREQDDQLSDRD